MKPVNTLFESQYFLQNDLPVWVNRYTEDFMVPYHSHDFIEFCYVFEGTGFHHIGKETFPIHKGLLYVIPVGVAHVFRPATPGRDSKPPVVYNCLFDPKLAAKLSLVLEPPIQEHLVSLENNTLSYYSVIDHDGAIEAAMLMLHKEVTHPAVGSRTMLYALLNQLIVTVYRLKFIELEPAETTSADFQHVIHYVEHNYNQAVTLTELSRLSGWSTRHLQRLFLTHTSQTFGSFLQNLRIQKSCELLRGSNLKISLISESVGYRSIDSFNKAFKQSVGFTPTQYRKSVRP
ncbi:helix-turn-helix transcriptional regulator [Paenibacillus sp. HN-1]|uniref:AraC family transcriptional regulator n=1 Tax=Paenibacillus TaxID=44249 RepID=UPI001CA7E9B0|nr:MULTISPECIES: AraC family transcriptional regulator [Paenibacillus]MBY9080731.1 helix-turn-helix transcriptional regulator [Paenibacillus sp. CGMCC 1.18879]MBY9085277.1 helix-turn-helix transcriptional regulator [Paenibacillus sinensis]